MSALQCRRNTGRALAGAVLKVAVLCRDPKKLRRLRDFLATDDGSIELQVWPAGVPVVPEFAAMIERERPGVLLAEPGGEGETRTLEWIAARHPEMTVILLGARRPPGVSLAAWCARGHRASCGEWRHL